MMRMEIEFFTKYLFVFFLGALVTYVLTPMIMRLAKGIGMIDLPDSRRIHRQPIPRGGGIAVFLGFHAACAAVFLLPWLPFVGGLNAVWWWRFFGLSTLLLIVGFADDLKGLRPLVKLSGQALVAVLAFMLDMRVGKILGVALPGGVDLVVTVLWFLAIINAFNLIDGMDGLATGLAAIAAFGLAGSAVFRRAPADTLVLLGLAGACLGFLRYNFSPASVFLGDSGSMFLGFVLAAIPVSTSAKGAGITAIVLPLLAVGVPMFDTALAVWRRTTRKALHAGEGESATADGQLFRPDLDHLHHRLIRSGLSQRAVAGWLYVLSVGLVVVGLLSMTYHSYAHGIYLLAFVVGSYVVVRHLARVELWDSGMLIMRGLSRPPSKVLVGLLHPPLDFLALAAALGLAVFFSTPDLPAKQFKLFWFDQLLIWAGIPFLAMAVSGTYSRVWSRARVSEYVLLALSILAGVIAAAGVAVVAGAFKQPAAITVVDLGTAADTTLIMGRSMPRGFLLEIVIYTAAALLFVVGRRAFPRAVQDAMAWALRYQSGRTDGLKILLVYGAGARCTLFLHERSLSPVAEQARRRIVGLLDDDRDLHGRLVHGYRVLGGIDAAEALMRKHRVSEIVVTEPLQAEAKTNLLDAAQRGGATVSEWTTVLRPLESRA
jgi:UDP-GlcNAc:undecaprenyl-phosphate/decaprenyl-phosphate GlcNAc-1-phosphate transferase